MSFTKASHYFIGIMILLLIFNSGATCWKIKNIFKRKKEKSKQIRVLEDQAKKQFDRQIPNCEDYGLHGCDPTTPDACSECYSRCGRHCEDFLWLSLEAVNFRLLPRAESQKECKLPSGKKSTRILCYTTAGRRHIDPTEQIIETMSISNPQDIEGSPTQVNEVESMAPDNLPGIYAVPMTQKMQEESESSPYDASAVTFRPSGQKGTLVSSIELEMNGGKLPSNLESGSNTRIIIICGLILFVSVGALFIVIIYKKRQKRVADY
ncbi:uncharacterized protein cubi_00523 [Cryptosporidium ubiquitum]|uniref:Uncharacterized protein n=1 Tax=Cryptosporidium ubiquitum TaxID=857276 RepID=A0A1J4MFB4_9CRYT|nr:uncharacterized protein cubi_00523 [Cryptosporidium ubiquitum]OII71716.1 hypothetical protein cubi_00523 [Cryptosporidium ubiquitum]